MTPRRIAFGLALAFASLALTAPPAQAQTREERIAARQHFQRALELFGEEQYEAALVEFEAAYEAVPNPALLYNLGSVHAALGHSVEAVDAFEAYLENAQNVPAERRAEVEGTLTTHRARIGRVHVRTNVEGATITVDGEDVGTAPLAAPIRLTVGSHTFSARAPDHDQPRTRVDVAGGTETTVELTLQRSSTARGVVRIRTTPHTGVTVLVNGREVGVTPLRETVPVEPGPVTVSGRRRGYLDASESGAVTEDAELSVALELDIDPNAHPSDLGELDLRAPSVERTLLVDGREVDTSSRIELPVGEHALQLRVEERVPIRDSIVIEEEEPTVFAPSFTWTDEARRTRVDRADTTRFLGWIVGAAGLVTTGVGAAVLIWNETLIAEQNDLWKTLNSPGGCYFEGTVCETANPVETARLEELGGNPERKARHPIRYGAMAALGVGVIAMGFGIGLLIAAPSEEDIDAAANDFSATLRVTPTSAELVGTF